jgi:hypothetical protein
MLCDNWNNDIDMDCIKKEESMKITKKERREIIKRSIADVKAGDTYLCYILSKNIKIVKTGYYPPFYCAIRGFIPEFKQTTAVKHFNAHRLPAWWDTQASGQRNRLRFLNYLLTGKLPKKVKK